MEYSHHRWGIGIVDMIKSIEYGVPHRASSEMAYHVMDVFNSLEIAFKEHRDVQIASTSPQPEGLYTAQEEYLWK